MERRHNLGRGTLGVLALVPESGMPGYEQRHEMLELIVATDAVFSGYASRPVPCNAVVLTPTLRVEHADTLAFYQRLREANRALRCDFFEGVVMKRADLIYPVQLRAATEECTGWVKHRYLVIARASGGGVMLVQLPSLHRQHGAASGASSMTVRSVNVCFMPSRFEELDASYETVAHHFSPSQRTAFSTTRSGSACLKMG